MKLRSVLLYVSPYLSLLLISCSDTKITNSEKASKFKGVENSQATVKTVSDTSIYKNRLMGYDDQNRAVRAYITIENDTSNGFGLVLDSTNKPIEIVFELFTRDTIVATDIDGKKYTFAVR